MREIGAVVAALLLLTPVVAAADSDGDGLDDALEQALMERFLPQFMVSAGECDGLPAEFAAGEMEPRVVARNGTIYARAAPSARSAAGAARIEIQYFHLWGMDCGRLAHELDAEHVSVLVGADRMDAAASEWQALYWYAAAHEDTVCESSNGAPASAVEAEERGAQVWISRGKHASFLTEALCKWGCGGDSCGDVRRFTPPRILNLGEPGRWMNGVVWIESSRWTLSSKMATDFTDSVLARLDVEKAKKVTGTPGAKHTAQALVLGGGSTANALGTANHQTENALAISAEKTGNALKKSVKSVGRFLGSGKTKEIKQQ